MSIRTELEEYEAAVAESLTFEHAIATAQSKGLRVLVPRANQLFLDIDSDAAADTFAKHLEILQHAEPAVVVSVTPSKSGMPKRHIVVELERTLSHLERIALQAFLGSDLKREMLSWRRMKAGNPEPVLFFELPTAR